MKLMDIRKYWRSQRKEKRNARRESLQYREREEREDLILTLFILSLEKGTGELKSQ